MYSTEHPGGDTFSQDYGHYAEALLHVPGENTANLAPGTAYTVPLDGAPLAVAGSASDASTQELFALVGADKTQFGVARGTIGGASVDMLVRYNQGEPPILAGIFYGGDHQGNYNLIQTGEVSSRESRALHAPHVAASFAIEHNTLTVCANRGELTVRTGAVTSEPVPIEENSVWALPSHEVAKAVSLYQAYQAVMGSMPTYYVRCQVAAALAESAHQPDRSQTAVEILTKGTFEGLQAASHYTYDKLQQRRYLADVADRSPEALRTIIHEHVAAFHGARSSSLASIVEFSGHMQSPAVTIERANGLVVGGGDNVSLGPPGPNTGMSFAALTNRGMDRATAWYAKYPHVRHRTVDDLEHERQLHLSVAARTDINPVNAQKSMLYANGLAKAIDYINAHPDSAYAELMLDDFPVLMGVSDEALMDVPQGRSYSEERHYGSGDQHEVQPQRGSLSLKRKDIPVIAVPRDRVKKVMQILQGHQYPTKVLAIEDLVPQHYY